MVMYRFFFKSVNKIYYLYEGQKFGRMIYSVFESIKVKARVFFKYVKEEVGLFI